jgi:hypothetical protein
MESRLPTCRGLVGSSHATDQEMILKRWPAQGSEKACLPDADTAFTELRSGGNGRLGFGNPDF